MARFKVLPTEGQGRSKRHQVIKRTENRKTNMQYEDMHFYCLYNLQIQSALVLQEQEVEVTYSDIIIRFGSIQHPNSAEMLADGSLFWAQPNAAYVRWENIGACLVRFGREIIVAAERDVDEYALRLLVLGPALILLLQQRGHIVLHGSIVDFNGNGVAFVGDSGAGKSTIAAAFAQRGCRVISDDLTVVYFEHGHPYALPGPPQSRLLPDSVHALGYDPSRIPRVHPAFEKRALSLIDQSSDRAVPLRLIYLLSDINEAVTPPLEARAAFLALARFYYLHAVMLLKATGGEAQLLQCATIAGQVPVRRLRQHPPLAALGDLELHIEQHLSANSSRPERRVVS